MIGGISTLGSMLQTRWQIQSMQTQMNRLTTEISSGRKTDPLGPLGGNAALLYQLHAQSDQQTTLQTTVTNALGRLEATQTALSAVGASVQSIANEALTPDSSSGQGQSVLASQAQNSMVQVISQLNTQYEGSSLFAGDNTNTAPMQSHGCRRRPVGNGEQRSGRGGQRQGRPVVGERHEQLHQRSERARQRVQRHQQQSGAELQRIFLYRSE